MKDFLKNLLGTAISSFAGSFYPVIALGGLLAASLIYTYTLRQKVKDLKQKIELITNDKAKVQKQILIKNDRVKIKLINIDRKINKIEEQGKIELEKANQEYQKLQDYYSFIFNQNNEILTKEQDCKVRLQACEKLIENSIDFRNKHKDLYE